MRVALYARVSTERQERERTTGSQVEALQARAAAEGWAVEMSCADNGHSGARLDRPGLDQVRDAAAAGRIDAVVALPSADVVSTLAGATPLKSLNAGSCL